MHAPSTADRSHPYDYPSPRHPPTPSLSQCAPATQTGPPALSLPAAAAATSPSPPESPPPRLNLEPRPSYRLRMRPGCWPRAPVSAKRRCITAASEPVLEIAGRLGSVRLLDRIVRSTRGTIGWQTGCSVSCRSALMLWTECCHSCTTLLLQFVTEHSTISDYRVTEHSAISDCRVTQHSTISDYRSKWVLCYPDHPQQRFDPAILNPFPIQVRSRSMIPRK